MRPSEKITKIIEEESEIFQKKLSDRITPILQEEFKKAKKRYPRLKKVWFGNGTHSLDIEPDSDGNVPDEYTGDGLPKALIELNECCEIAYDDTRVWSIPDGDLE